MKTKKPKRIRAEKRYISLEGWVHRKPFDDDYLEPCYILRQSDIRALAEQMVEDMYFYGKSWENSMLYALRRAGMTPGKGTQ